MKKVLLFDTALATSNIGDEIILASVKKGLSPILYNAMCFRLATHIENYSPIQMLYPGKKLTSICYDADYKFIAGTNLFETNLFHVRPQWWVNHFNKKLYFNSILVGIGKTTEKNRIENTYTKELYKLILNPKYKHSVRDGLTKTIVEELGYKAINTGCPTLWGFTTEKCRRIPQKRGENIVFSVSGYKNQSDPRADREMLNCLFQLYNRKYAWIQTTSDEEYLFSLLSTQEKNEVECIYSLEKYAAILDSHNVDYVGTRLHGGIFALQHNVRSIIISIDHRADEFHKAHNIPILKRDSIGSLEELINKEFETRIIVNRDSIDEFLEQFL